MDADFGGCGAVRKTQTHTQSEWVIGGQGNTNVRQSWRDRQRDRGSLDYLSTSTWWMAPLQHSCQDFTERQNTQTARCTTDKTKVGLKSVSVISVRGICGTTVFLLVQPPCVIMTEIMAKQMPPQAENKNSRNQKKKKTNNRGHFVFFCVCKQDVKLWKWSRDAVKLLPQLEGRNHSSSVVVSCFMHW